jgi:alkylphosphonate utilization operon protein PhnA
MLSGPSTKAHGSPINYRILERITAMDVKDSNGAILKDGDNVTLIKDLKVKGSSTTLKRGTMIKGIRLTGDPDEIDCKHEKVKGLVLRAEFVRKA